MIMGTKIFTSIILCMVAQILIAQQNLLGKWQYQTNYGQSEIIFNADNTILVDGETANYSVEGNIITVSNAYGSVNYQYGFNNGNLVLTFSDGTTVELHKAGQSNNLMPKSQNSVQTDNCNQNPQTSASQQTDQNQLLGKWVYNSNQGNIVLSVNSANSLTYNGEQLTYYIANNSFMVNNGYGVMPYPFKLNGDKLTITFPEGYSLTFNRSNNSTANSQQGYGGNGSSGQLYGRLCYYSSSSDSYSGYSRTEYIYFDGAGRFQFYNEASFSSGSGMAYGGDQTPETGSYTINGDNVTLTMDAGGSYTFRVNMRQNSGQITELMYGQKLYATGLCQ